MKFSINQKTLETELSFVQGIVEKKSTIPILANVLIESVDEQTIKITATDLDTTIISRASANVNESGEMCVSAKKLYDIVKLLPREDILVATDAATFWAKIEAGKSNFKIAGVSRHEFPEEITFVGKKTILTTEILQELIKHTSFAITNEQSRFTLSGAKFELHGRTARMITTDGHRLAYIETILDKSAAGSTDVLIPRKALTELVKLTAESSGEISFWEDTNHLYFESENRRLIIRKLSGTFPNYEMVIPKDNDQIVIFKATDMLSALGRVCQMSDERTHAVNLTIKKGEIIISAQSSEEGAANESIPAEYKGEETLVKFQHEYIRDFINSVKDEDDSHISMSFKDGNSQFLFRPANENGREYLGVIMPLRY